MTTSLHQNLHEERIPSIKLIQIRLVWLYAAVFLMAAIQESPGTPQFARQTSLNCIHCHVVPPKLTVLGEAFLAQGYREGTTREEDKKSLFSTVPLAVWITSRYEDQSSKDFSEAFLPKVELISGGAIGDLPLSYFVEWRIVSQQTRSDGSLLDRGGRFEDAFLNWEINDRNTFRIGQFRSLNQYDVSRRLSVSEPAVFSTSLPGDPTSNSRIQSLRAFSPAGRSPGLAYTFQSIQGDVASDGLFHVANLPFVGELSLPLSEEARDAASFELEGPAKGLFLESFYRKGLNSIGAHGFIDDDRWLATAVGTMNYNDFYATAAIGLDDRERLPRRKRYSAELEYLPTWYDRFRPGAGFRVEYISNSNGDPAYIPYLILSGPNTKYTFQLQLECRIQENNNAVFLDLSTLF